MKRALLTLLVLLLTLAACGGGGGGATSMTPFATTAQTTPVVLSFDHVHATLPGAFATWTIGGALGSSTLGFEDATEVHATFEIGGEAFSTSCPLVAGQTFPVVGVSDGPAGGVSLQEFAEDVFEHSLLRFDIESGTIRFIEAGCETTNVVRVSPVRVEIILQLSVAGGSTGGRFEGATGAGTLRVTIDPQGSTLSLSGAINGVR